MVERLRQSRRDILNRQEIAACVYGEASTFHVDFGAMLVEGLVQHG